MKTLDFFQVWFEDDQQEHFYDFATPYYNELVTPYFENNIIAKLPLQSQADLIGVASWRLKEKRNSLPVHRALKSTVGTRLSLEKILSKKFDVAILTPMMPGHRMLSTGQQLFGNIWTESFNHLSTFLTGTLSMKIPDEISFPIYGNHFIATREVYRRYITECLIPTIEFMEAEPAMFLRNSGYAKTKSNAKCLTMVRLYKDKSGRDDWPIAPFLLERLFSLWIDPQNLQIINL